MTSSTTAPADTDVFPTVESMGGTPATKRKAWSVLKAAPLAPTILTIADGGELTIVSGAVTATGSRHNIDTEGDAVTDDLTTISGLDVGSILILRCTSAARDVVVKDGTPLRLAGDCTLGVATDQIVLIRSSSTTWNELCRSINS
jgi:hypothetical protein